MLKLILISLLFIENIFGHAKNFTNSLNKNGNLRKEIENITIYDLYFQLKKDFNFFKFLFN